MTPRKVIDLALRRAERAKVKPILKYERYSTAPSAKPVAVLLTVLAVLLLFVIPVAQHYFGQPETQCERVK